MAQAAADGAADAHGLPSRHGAASHTRVLHLSLAGTSTKARYVIDDRSDWEGFVAGVVERLKARPPYRPLQDR